MTGLAAQVYHHVYVMVAWFAIGYATALSIAPRSAPAPTLDPPAPITVQVDPAPDPAPAPHPRPRPRPHPRPAPDPLPAPIDPVPAPQPTPQPRPAPGPVHTGHLWVTYVEARYGSPAAGAVRDELAGVDWKGLDATFRAYTEGQEQLALLKFATHFTTADLPILFVQDGTLRGGGIIDTMRGPASADAVVSRIRELRGQ